MDQRLVGKCGATLALALAAAAPPAAAGAQVVPGEAQGAAQSTGTIRGTITEATTQRPLADVQVVLVGTRLGGVTNAAGVYTITGAPPVARSVRVRRIGYTPLERAVTVTAGAAVEVSAALTPSATELDRVVVTGTAGPVERRTLGNSVTQLNVEEITQQSSLSTVTDVLQSRSPGVQLVPGSGTAGTAADIRIRGTSSLSGSNRPIFFIDGVRLYDGPAGNFGPSGTGDGTFAQGVSALDVINPDDIESIEVIKGPAAATLYGADAAGGVIQIITKKGARGRQAVRWGLRAEGGGTSWALPRYDNYTTCTAARVAPGDTITTGTDRGKPNWPGCVGQPVGTVLTNNPLRDESAALRTGAYQNHSLSARGGGENYSFYVSGDYSMNQGVFRNNYAEQASGRANFSYAASEKFDFGVATNYIRARTRLPLGDDAAGGIILSATRGQPGRATYNGFGVTNTRGWSINTPEVSNEYDNQLESDRYLTSATVNVRPFTWFRNRFTAGLDNNAPTATIFYAPNTVFSQSVGLAQGSLVQRIPQTRVLTFDYAGTVSNTLPRDFTSELTVGAQGIKTRTQTLRADANGLPSADFGLIQAATTISASSALQEQASLGYYLQEQIGFANRLFLTGAVRADDNSAFGSEFTRVIYPKGSLSYVVSEEPGLARFFRAARADNLRLRFAYGEAGRAPGPYDALRTYNSFRTVQGSGTVVSGLVPEDPGNADLRAERGREFEYGLDASFLTGRVGLELTGYNKRTSDALVSISNAPSTGFTASRFVNFGEIKNRGVELSLRGTPVVGERFGWDAQFTLATNRNELTKLNIGGITQLIPFNPYPAATAPVQIIREGFPVAGFWAVDVRRNADGSFATNPAGTRFVLDTANGGPSRYVGPADPTYVGSFSNTFTLFKNFRVYGLIDFKGGNYLFNQRDRNRDQAANRNSERFNDPTHPEYPTTRVDSAYWSGLNPDPTATSAGTASPITAPWIQPADFVKFRDLSLSYTLPPSLLRVGRFENATVTVAAHNIGFISKKYDGIDPEVNFFGRGTFFSGTSNFIQFVRTDSYTLPMTRRITAALNVNF